jgi:hypothetical protein
MSLTINSKDNQFAYVLNSKGQKVATVSLSDSVEAGLPSIELEDGYKFCLAPRPVKEKERVTMSACAESGAGKSFFIREYVKRYNEMFPKNPIYLISYLDKDETLDEYKKIIRLDAFKPEFLDQCSDMDIELEFGHSFVIFDDIDSITSKKMKDKIYGLLNKMLRIGRHFHISVAYIGHELYNSNDLKSILNESQTITFFPRFLNFKKMKYLLEVYFGLSKEQIKRIRGIKDRSVTFIKGSDKVILSDTQCYVLENDF